MSREDYLQLIAWMEKVWEIEQKLLDKMVEEGRLDEVNKGAYYEGD